MTDIEDGRVTRRDLLRMGQAFALPALAGGASAHAAGAAAAGPLKAGPEIFQSIGVEPVINCRGTFTIIGGSVERPEVRAAMDAASRHFVQIDELAMAVGQRFAELTGAEWGMVSAGCAAGLKHVTAACVTGGNPERLVRIPDLTGFDKTEVVSPRYSRNVYDAAIRNIGVTMITVDTPEEFERALGPRTAMIYLNAGDATSSGPLSLENVARMARPKNIPILIDAAAEVLTIPNVHLQQGATIVAYSGGKALCGPQCAGLLLGRKDLLMSAWQASAPHHGPGRDNKVGREETLGMLAAVEAWVTRDHDADWKTWLVVARRHQRTRIHRPWREDDGPVADRTVEQESGPDHLVGPGGTAHHGRGRRRATGAHEAAHRARCRRSRSPGRPATTSISVTAWMMQPGDARIVADRIHAVLSAKREPRSTAIPAPATSVAGRWDVDIAFSSSRSRHTLSLEQDGNWLRGTHQGDFSTRDVAGTIEGSDVTLRSVERRPGSSVTFTFSGTVSGDALAGSIHMGEYLTATFTAKKHEYPAQRTRIVVPKGPPLAT